MSNELGNKYIVKHNKGGYQVMLYNNGKHLYVGIYKDIKDAIIARDKALKELKIIPKYQKGYIDNREMYIEMVWSKAQGKITDKLFTMCIKIVKGVSKKFKYNNEDDRADCEAYAYEIIVKNWFNFNEEVYDNVFAYITECVKRAFAMQFKQLQKTRHNTISLDYQDEEGHKVFNI